MIAIYRHFNAQGRLLYVGISGNIQKRTDQHKLAPWIGDVKNTHIEWRGTEKLAQIAEAVAILEEKPLFNSIHAVGDEEFADSAEAIKRLRLSNSMDQRSFAEAIGVKRARLSNWEAGTHRLSLSGALAIRARFGTSLDVLFPEATP